MKRFGISRKICASLAAAVIICSQTTPVLASEWFVDSTGLPSANDWSMVSSPNEIKTAEPVDLTPVPQEQTKQVVDVPTVGQQNLNNVEGNISVVVGMPESPKAAEENTEKPTTQPSAEGTPGFLSSFDADIEKPAVIDANPAKESDMAMPSAVQTAEPVATPPSPTAGMSIETPKAASGSAQAEAEYQSKETPEMEDISKPKTLQRKEAPSIMETTKWTITGENRTNKIIVNVLAGQTRFEMFYSAAAPMPAITFTSIDGNIYRAGEDFNNGRTSFICRPGNKIDGFADVNYCVMYFSAPTDPGSWTAEITLDKGTKEFMLVKTAVPNGWTDFTQEYRMTPEEMCLWHLSKVSDYTPSELINLANTDTNPGGNTIASGEAPVVEKIDYTIPLIVTVFVILVGGMIAGTVFIIRKSNREEEEYTKRRISRANKALQKKKEAQDRNLASALKELNEDYSDDDYFSETSTFEEVDEEIEIPVQKNMEAYNELVIDNEDAPSMEEVKETEKSHVEMPAWLSEENMAATFF